VDSAQIALTSLRGLGVGIHVDDFAPDTPPSRCYETCP
jgi:hypothetical protein